MTTRPAAEPQWQNEVRSYLRVTTRCAMRRSIYDEDHEAFRSSVREFLDRP